jgi:uncharacterized protein (DUF58 family)
MKQRIFLGIKLFIIFFFVCTLFSYAMFQGGFVSWFLFFGSLPIFLYMGLLLIYPLSRLKIERRIHQNVIEAGNGVKVEVLFKREIFFPIYYCIIEDIMPESISYRDTKHKKFAYLSHPSELREKQGAKKVIFPWLKRSFSFEYYLKNVPRGEHFIKDIRIVTGDFIGIVKREKIFHVPTKLIAYPAERKVTIHKQAESFEEGSSQSYNRTFKNTNVVSGVREYAPGDRVSWIDWKASARKNEIMTKEFDQEKSHDMLLLFDATYYEHMNWLAFEGAVEVAYSLLGTMRQESSRLVFSSLGATKQTFSITNEAVSNHQVLSFLTKIQPKPSLPFERMVKQEAANLQRGFSVLVITTKLTKDLYDTLITVKQKSPRTVLFLVNSLKWFTPVEHELIKRLKNFGIIVNLLTEEKLIKQSFEVNA